jgi:4-carboxymuconolactone decarboxylase
MTEPAHSDERQARGARTFEEVLGFGFPGANSPLTEAARDFVFAEVWSRPGLDRRSRRWITLACVCAAGVEIPIRIYLTAALDSGDITPAELHEFVLQFASFQGFPRAVRVDQILGEVLAARASKQP